MKPSHRLLVSVLLLLAVAGIGSAAAQTVIVVCHPCIMTYQDCLDSGQSPNYCQTHTYACCPPMSSTQTGVQPVADRANKSGKA
ncbi:hypothetical protein ATSB10_11470 [Dyella thiooxydans]|uniref:Uncharacterized protein n=1 Tax=Dyella thiooxydans TaxID=445710 RepID=A0A160MYY8_9GAMM|nr:hypothetical protein [Dyella thiooxydans]AND68601.1 hypothetical protein ATSB10_11470 [Dyella thiooxydans]